MVDAEIPTLLIGISIGFGLGVLAALIVAMLDERRARRPSGSPAGESEGWTRKTWPGARKHDTTEEN